jgi:diadenosine tetraphosphate (Ap4A) HIT family hydrolase
MVVGKDVPHFHVHLIPRLLDDNLEEHKKISYKNEEEKVNLVFKIKNAL